MSDAEKQIAKDTAKFMIDELVKLIALETEKIPAPYNALVLSIEAAVMPALVEKADAWVAGL